MKMESWPELASEEEKDDEAARIVTLSEMALHLNEESGSEPQFDALVKHHLGQYRGTTLGLRAGCDLLKAYRYLVESLSSCKTLLEALEHLKLFYDNFSVSSRIVITSSEEHIHIRFVQPVSKQKHDQQSCLGITCMIMVALKRLCEWLTDCPLTVIDAGMDYPRPENRYYYDQWLGCEIKFDEPFSFIAIPAACHSQPIVKGVLSIRELFSQSPAELIQVRKIKTLKEQVGDIISNRPYRDLPSVNEIAVTLDMSKSKLYADLRREGCSYIDIKNERVMKGSMEYVCNTELKLSDVSRALGFRSAGGFYRFFKNNTGFTPSEYRRRHTCKVG